MRWFSCPENKALQLTVTPRPESWNAKDHPDQQRLRDYLAATEELVDGARILDRPWALRLDVGAPRSLKLHSEVADLDNYLHPLSRTLENPNLVSVWATKRNDPRPDPRSYVEIADAVETSPPAEMLTVRTTAAVSSSAYKDQIINAVAGARILPEGSVRLELSFVIGDRSWRPLWKPTIDALDGLLGRTYPDRPYHPLDGRIVELGMHVTVDPDLGYEVEIGIAPSPFYVGDRSLRRVLFGQRVTCPKCGAVPDMECPTAYGVNHSERMAAFDESRLVAGRLGFADPTTESEPDEVLATLYGEWPPRGPWTPEVPIPARPPHMFGWTLHNNDLHQ